MNADHIKSADELIKEFRKATGAPPEPTLASSDGAGENMDAPRPKSTAQNSEPDASPADADVADATPEEPVEAPASPAKPVSFANKPSAKQPRETGGAPDENGAKTKPTHNPRPPQKPPTKPQVVDVPHRPAPPPAELQSLSPIDPALGLVSRLKEDELVTEPIWSIYRHISLYVAIAGFVLIAVDRLIFALAGNLLIGGIRFTWYAGSLAAIGMGVSLYFWMFAKGRDLPLDFEVSQEKEWEKARDRVKLQLLLRWAGIGAAAFGPVFSTIMTVALPDSRSLPYVYAGGAVLLLGLGLAITAHIVHRIAVRNYIQTTVLWVLERSESIRTASPREDASQPTTGPISFRDRTPVMDDRTQHVMRSLDHLLAQLPESAVRGFMQTEEARHYIDMMDELREA